MSETKIEWVVQRKMRKGHWFDWATKESEQDAIDSILRSTKQEPMRKFQLIKRTTVTTEEIVK